MGIVVDTRATMLPRGMRQEQLDVARRFHGVLATGHTLQAGAEWWWPARPADGEESAVMLIAEIPLTISCDDGAPQQAPPGSLCFLRPHHDTRVIAIGAGAVMCLWVPWSALSEIEPVLPGTGLVIAPSPLGLGLQAFLSSLLTQHTEPTVITDRLVERLLAEMVFGVLVEAAPHVLHDGEAGRIDRARSIMRARRAERDFGVVALAHDMHMSVRQLQRLFAAEDSAPAEELRRIRVELARELMSDADCAPLGIAEIAAHSGFPDAAGLRRAFARSGLPSPRIVRRAGRA
ncbi:helix-turn-helix domain-containing protein [Microbacterium azadirachtae]|uniref:Transcriptional activator FtrA n=1 Tax=Microbacterium azadirachtae TaxID=582680 RepID=A0A0F0LFZ4_9MICO|nr:helix-turn-helix domain-containing protein [Microbacterium azadirachtae]KJL31175.1 transcriptional activator FtrA [Microbacterium azadirachtae]